MGLLSVLSGKIYHFNTINTPLNNNLFNQIQKLDDSIEKIFLTACFSISHQMVLSMFNPDDGMFSKQVKELTEKKLKTIWFILMLACVEHNISKSGNESSFGQSVLTKLADLFGQSKEKIDDLIKVGNMREIDDLFFIEIWHQICNVLNVNPENKINSTSFIMVFSDTYNTHMKAVKE